MNKTSGIGYHVYPDRYYTSVLLAKELFQRQVYLIGTIQKNRVGLPREVKQLKLRNLQRKAYRHSDDLMALGWKDKRLVLMLSSWHNADTTLHHRWVKGKEEEIKNPVSLLIIPLKWEELIVPTTTVLLIRLQEKLFVGGGSYSFGFLKLVWSIRLSHSVKSMVYKMPDSCDTETT